MLGHTNASVTVIGAGAFGLDQWVASIFRRLGVGAKKDKTSLVPSLLVKIVCPQL